MPHLRLFDYAASANCYKVRLALAQLGIRYERVPVDIFDGQTLTPAFGAMNPLRSTPVLQVAEDDYLIESNAILLFLAESTSLMPSDRIDRAYVYRWLIFEQTDVMPTMGGLRFRLATDRLSTGDPEATRRRLGAIETLTRIDEYLQDREFLVGDRYGVADIALFGYVHVAGEAGLELKKYPAVGSWIERVISQPGYLNDLAPYPANATPGSGASIYD